MFFKQPTNSIPPEILKEYNTAQMKNAAKQFSEFIKAFPKGFCNLCGMKLSYFSPEEPCFHWLLLPEGIKKKHLIEYFKDAVGYFQLQSYLRWVASTEEKFRHINDLTPENKLVETTIRYKDLEWSFNIGHNDFIGHKGSKNGDFPHFHFQVVKNGLIQLKFNDCHIPLSKHDISLFDKINTDSNFEHKFSFGEGMSVIESEEEMEWVDEDMVPSEDESEGTFHTRTFYEIPEHITISAEEFEKLKEESKSANIPFRKYLKEKFPEIKLNSQLFPGPGIVAKKGRNKRK